MFLLKQYCLNRWWFQRMGRWSHLRSIFFNWIESTNYLKKKWEGVYPEKPICPPNRGHFKWTCLSSNHYFSGALLVFRGVKLVWLRLFKHKDPKGNNITIKRQAMAMYDFCWSIFKAYKTIKLRFSGWIWTWLLIYIPIGSMYYGIFAYIWLMFMVNVGKYTIHGSYGIDVFVIRKMVFPLNRPIYRWSKVWVSCIWRLSSTAWSVSSRWVFQLPKPGMKQTIEIRIRYDT